MNDKARVLFWDLETAGVNALNADLGSIVCFGYKWGDEPKPHVLTIDQFRGWFKKGVGLNDKPLLQASLNVMAQADMLVAHYGDKFDRREFNARLAIHGLNPPPPVKQRDTWRIARGALKLSSNRLDNLAMSLGLSERKHQKSRDEWPGWWHGALAGGAKAIHAMAKYCAQDVVVLEQIYLRLRAYDNQNHPRLYLDRSVCGLCGGAVQYHGVAWIGNNQYKRFQCNDCGRWGRESKKI